MYLVVYFMCSYPTTCEVKWKRKLLDAYLWGTVKRERVVGAVILTMEGAMFKGMWFFKRTPHGGQKSMRFFLILNFLKKRWSYQT